ncbi:hypothetical protein J0871_16820 [Salegentibacter sp. BDJ18]|uniref:hypothetical protein n=1 Tax=Salegentibacter sp. BDJ18 TaxID=2816376 RepID=UPI001AAFBF68|nr:hypothetical protein [Salegentibacter sp. BDJ18]MBO2546081.1 hypothetical protein [Salegentibacter sp. BDJ18]
MILSSRVPNLKNICGIAIDLSALPMPSYSAANQNFYDSYLLESSAKSAYFGKRSVSFREKSKPTRAGDIWTTELSIQFPGTDSKRAVRLDEFRKAKFVLVQLSNGQSFYMGRNDFFQNTPPVIEIQTDQQLCQVKFTVESIMQTGFLPEYNGDLLPHDVPVNLTNS